MDEPAKIEPAGLGNFPIYGESWDGDILPRKCKRPCSTGMGEWDGAKAGMDAGRPFDSIQAIAARRPASMASSRVVASIAYS